MGNNLINVKQNLATVKPNLIKFNQYGEQFNNKLKQTEADNRAKELQIRRERDQATADFMVKVTEALGKIVEKLG